jgi:methylated-DNA-[protein]-cysteine S-methyltransferase
LKNQDVTISTCETDFGWVGIAASPRGLLSVTLPQPTEAMALHRLRDRWPEARPAAEGESAEIGDRLRRYFAGQTVSFDEVLLDMSQATSFQQRVWEVTRAIPRGQTRTYGEIARQVGSPRAARAVGQAMANNPWPVIVPCHRVLGSDGRLTGFGGGLEMKRRMLEIECAPLLSPTNRL